MVERIGDQPIKLVLSNVGSFEPTLPKMDNQFESMILQAMLKTGCLDQHFNNANDVSTTPNLAAMVNRIEPSPEENAVVSQNNEPRITDTCEQFIATILPCSKQLSRVMGLDVKMILAQIALETGWGKAIAKDSDGTSSHNLFNIKAGNHDEAVQINTTEFINNNPVSTSASFKKYSSIEQSFNDYLSLLQGLRYHEALENTHDPERYIRALHHAGYATDPSYAQKILSIYHGEKLQNVLDNVFHT